MNVARSRIRADQNMRVSYSPFRFLSRRNFSRLVFSACLANSKLNRSGRALNELTLPVCGDASLGLVARRRQRLRYAASDTLSGGVK